MRYAGYVAARLRRLAERHESIGDLCGNGLFIVVELVADRLTEKPAPALAAVVYGLRGRRVLTGSIGPHDNVIELRPPLVLSRDGADFLIDRLDDTLGSCRDL